MKLGIIRCMQTEDYCQEAEIFGQSKREKALLWERTIFS